MVSIVVAYATGAAIAWGTVAQAVLFIVSVVVQQQAAAAAKARQAAAQAEAIARADAAKGTSVVTEGQSQPLRVIYGRNLVGGTRVYHNTMNTYTPAAPAVGGTCFAANPNGPPVVVSYFPDTSAWYDIFAKGAFSLASLVNYSLGSAVNGAKHEFLYTQQALCYGGINSIVQVDVDSRVYDSPEFIYGQRIHVYTDGGVADPLMVANDPSRATALFTNTAYATAVYRLNRDQPQYSGVPNLQFYVEGMKIANLEYTGNAWQMSAAKTYSNNPALVLLDYLTNPVYGRGLPVEQIDLLSFKNAQDICDKVVMSDVSCDGKFWKAKLTADKQLTFQATVTIPPIASGGFRIALPNLVMTVNNILCTKHGLASGAVVKFSKVPLNSGLLLNTNYYVVNPTVDTFQIASAPGGGVISLLVNGAGSLASSNSIRSIKLYECNLGIDTTKTIRENIDLILGTMGMAELIWAGGVYKLNTLYPYLYDLNVAYVTNDVVQYTSNGVTEFYRCLVSNTGTSPSDTTAWAKNVIAAYITDDHLVRATPNNIAWPNAQSRLNYCTVKFLNEAQNFVEDSVSWPPKTGTIEGPQIDMGAWNANTGYGKSDIVTYTGTKYQLKTGTVRVLGAAIYSGNWNPGDGSYMLPQVVNGAWEMTWQPPLHFQARSGIVYPRGSLVNVVSYNAAMPAPARWSYPVYTQYQALQDIYYNANTTPVGNSLWQLYVGATRVSSTPPPSDPAWVLYADTAVYNAYRAQDSQLPLETEAFETGCVDYYHALASAEQRVRSSRANVTYELSLDRALFNLEPGDLVNVTSTVLGIPGEILRIDTVKASKEGSIDISATKYDAANLAWNAKDNEVVAQRNIYDFSITQASNVRIDTTSNTSFLGTGFLVWDAAADIRVSQYVIKYTFDAIATINANTVWQDLATVQQTMFELPSLGKSYVVAVASRGTGQIAKQAGWPILYVDSTRFSAPGIADFSMSVVSDGILAAWTPTTTVRLDSYEIRKGNFGWNAGVEVQAGITSNFFKLPPTSAGTTTYMVKALDIFGNYSAVEGVFTLVLEGPLALVIKGSVSGADALFEWNTPQYPWGIDYYEVLDQSMVTIGKIKSTIFRVPVDLNHIPSYFFRAIDIYGNASPITQAALSYALPSTPTNFTVKVIDNNVLMYWGTPSSVLPIRTYRIYKGNTFQPSGLVGEKSGQFTTLFESAGGTYIYWITAVDSGGGESAPTSVSAVVSQPPDFQLVADYNSDFTLGTYTNAFWDGNAVLLPVDTSATFQQHFLNGSTDVSKVATLTVATPTVVTVTAHGYADLDVVSFSSTLLLPTGILLNVGYYVKLLTTNTFNLILVTTGQTGALIAVTAAGTGILSVKRGLKVVNDQIAVGAPGFAAPPPALGTYSETMNYGTVLSGCVVSVNTLTLQLGTTASVAGAVPAGLITISYKKLLADPWISFVGVNTCFASGFQYVKVDINVPAASQADMLEIKGLNITLSTKTKNGSGSVVCAVEGAPKTLTVAAGVNPVFTSVAHGLLASDCIQFRTTGALPAGLNLNTDYFLVNVTANTFQVTEAYSVAPTLTTVGTGVLTAVDNVDGTAVFFNQNFYSVISIQTTANGTVPLSALYNYVGVPMPKYMKVLIFDSAGVRVAGDASWSCKGY